MSERSPAVGSAGDAYREWDAAYVLGSLTVDERLQFERHLADCAGCALRVGELAGVPGILAALPDDRGLALLDDEVAARPPPSLAANAVLAARRARARARARLAVAAGALVAAVVTAVVVTIAALDRDDRQAIAMRQAVPGPITASVTVGPMPGGSTIEVTCHYDGGAAGGREFEYLLVITDDRGTRTTGSSWRASPGMTVRSTTTTSLDAGEIARLEITLVGRGLTVLVAEF